MRISTPPVCDASTKPSAATVLPAPVACSNQNRLAAFGSSGCSASDSSSPSSSTQSRGSSSGSPSGSGSSSVWAPPRRSARHRRRDRPRRRPRRARRAGPGRGPRRPRRPRPVLVLGLLLVLILLRHLGVRSAPPPSEPGALGARRSGSRPPGARCRRGRGCRRRRAARARRGGRAAVAVRRGGGLRGGQQRRERARQRVDLVRGQHGAVGELRLVLGEHALEAEQQRELAPPGGRGVLGLRVRLSSASA